MKRRIFTALLLFAATPAFAGDAGKERFDRQKAMMTQAKLLVLTGKGAQALPILEQVIGENDDLAAKEKRRVYSGQTMQMVLSNMMVAAADKKDAVDYGPSYGEAVFFKGYILIDLGRGGEAAAFLDRAVMLSPSNPQFLCEDASWHARHNESALGLELYKRCEAENSMTDEKAQPHLRAVALRGQGYALIDLDRLDEAESRYRASLELEPDNRVALGDLQVIQQKRAAAAKSKT